MRAQGDYSLGRVGVNVEPLYSALVTRRGDSLPRRKSRWWKWWRWRGRWNAGKRKRGRSTEMKIVSKRERERGRENERRTGGTDYAEGGSLMSRRVPRTLRTLKLDYREIAALLLFPLASLPSPSASGSPRGSVPPLLRPPRSSSSSTTITTESFPESFLSFASPASPWTVRRTWWPLS